MIEQRSVDELLMAHAAGRLPEPVGLIVATHLALCPPARARYARFEALGGVFLESVQPAPLAPGAWDRLVVRLGAADDGDAGGSGAAGPGAVPRPLRDHLPGPLAALRWRSYGAAAEFELPLRTPGFRTCLVRVRAGRMVPRHTHAGSELTLVLDGSFHDELGRYRRGDLALADGAVDHRPVADEGQDCFCLAVTDAPLRLTGPIGRLLNPFVRF